MTEDEREIRALVEAWLAATKAGDMPAVLALMTDDVVFMTPGRPPFGKEEFAAGGEQMAGMKLEGRCEILELDVFGDRAYARNQLHITLTKPGEAPRRLSGYTLGIYRKETDGRWRLARDANLVMPDTG
jgi:uncharacterized protein (TIGR02246 family)